MSTDQPGGMPIERDAIEDRFKWKLEMIFPDWESWETSFKEIEAALPDLARRQGTLADSGAGLLETIEAIHAIQRLLEKTYVYAGMKSDEDTRIGENTARKGRISSLAVRMSEAVSWFESEVLEIEPDRLKELVAQEPGLELYDHFFHNIHRARAHTLTADKEALLAGAGLMSRGASQATPTCCSNPSRMRMGKPSR
jgi:oligoendopeptidase F